MSSMGDFLQNFKKEKDSLGNKVFRFVDPIEAQVTGLLDSMEEEVRESEAERSRWFSKRAEQKAEYLASAGGPKVKRIRTPSVEDEVKCWELLSSDEMKLKGPKLPSFVKLKGSSAAHEKEEVEVDPAMSVGKRAEVEGGTAAKSGDSARASESEVASRAAPCVQALACAKAQHRQQQGCLVSYASSGEESDSSVDDGEITLRQRSVIQEAATSSEALACKPELAKPQQLFADAVRLPHGIRILHANGESACAARRMRTTDAEGRRGTYTGGLNSEGEAAGRGRQVYDTGYCFVGIFINGAVQQGVAYARDGVPQFTIGSGLLTHLLCDDILASFPFHTGGQEQEEEETDRVACSMGASDALLQLLCAD